MLKILIKYKKDCVFLCDLAYILESRRLLLAQQKTKCFEHSQWKMISKCSADEATAIVKNETKTKHS